MPDTNMTRETAQRRAQLIQSDHYRILLDLSGRGPQGAPLATPDKHFWSESKINFTGLGAGSSHIDVVADEIISVTLDGKPLEFSYADEVTIPFEVTVGDHELVVVARYNYSRTGEGLHRFVDPVDQRTYLYSQFEVADARRAYACFDQPDLKATFQISVVAPRAWTVVSNAAAVKPTAVDEQLGRWDFGSTKKMSTYLTAVVAGEFHRVEHQIKTVNGQLPASLLCRQSLAEFLDDERIITTTQQGFALFEKDFGYPYPFDSYDQAFVPEFNFGAMENVGCVTFRDEYLPRARATSAQYETRDLTILHELAHMWFGDLVTMRWWDDLWLNESFAEWASHYALSEIAASNGGDPEHAWAYFCNSRKNWAYRQDQLSSTHPIAADMVDLNAVSQNFDGITYAKGCSVLRQLVAFVGKDAFLVGIRAYFAKYAFGNTELTDLLNELTAASGKDLSDWSAQWLETAGVNTIRADFTEADGKFTEFALAQTAPAEHPRLRSHRLEIGWYDLVDGRLQRTDSITAEISGATTEIPEAIGKPRPALLLINDNDLAYAKLRLDEQSLRTLINSMAVLDSELARALCWSAAWDMCRDAELSAGDYVALVLRGLASETDQTAVSATLAQAALAADFYTAPSKRAGVRQQLEANVVELLKAAAPGSDHQLSYARALTGIAHTPEVADLLTAWLNAKNVPDGLALDVDLRWMVVGGLARLGRLTEKDLAAEAERDPSITGQEHLAAARAAQPTAEAKAQAWKLAVSDPATPNETQRKVCLAFMASDQDQVLLPYREAYLRMAAEMSQLRAGWADRGPQLQNTALNYLFPMPIADREYLRQVEEWLAAEQPSPTVARGVAERRDAAERALKCQEFDATR